MPAKAQLKRSISGPSRFVEVRRWRQKHVHSFRRRGRIELAIIDHKGEASVRVTYGSQLGGENDTPERINERSVCFYYLGTAPVRAVLVKRAYAWQRRNAE